MIKRTVSGAVVESGGTPPQPTQPSELKRWEGRDEWGELVEGWYAAIDAAAAAEMFVERLVSRGDVDGPTTVSVRRVYPIGEWIAVAVHVELTVEAEISATRVIAEHESIGRIEMRPPALPAGRLGADVTLFCGVVKLLDEKYPRRAAGEQINAMIRPLMELEAIYASLPEVDPQ